MLLFLFTFLLIYGGMHAYAYHKVTLAWQLRPELRVGLIIFLVIMVLMPLLVHFLNRRGHEFTARLTAYPGYIWMGLLLLFFFLFMAVDVYNLLVRLAGAVFQSDLSRICLAGKDSFLFLIILVIAIGGYSFLDARRIRTERITLTTSKLPKGLERLTIAQISDLHLGLIVRHGLLKKVVAALVRAEPDLLVSTGDLVDAEINHLTGLAELFHQVKPTYGQFAVTGNHDFYAGIDQAVTFTSRAGFRLLRGEGVTVRGIFNIAGLDDRASPSLSRSTLQPDEEAILAGLPQNLFTIFLKHRPEVSEHSPPLFDLQLSGHTHAGQIFPFRWVVQLFFPRLAGLYDLPGHSYLYVSTGTGTWGPPMRFLAPPRITVIEIISTDVT